MIKLLTIIISLVSFSIAENLEISSFNKAKKILEKEVYSFKRTPRRTVYCDATFKRDKRITDQNGYKSNKYRARSRKIEWEHIVPAENFGRAFSEWRNGHKKCVKKDGTTFKGRNCARKANKTFRYMESDLYNLYPAIGSVNAMRSNKKFGMSTNKKSLGTCNMYFDGKIAEPPDRAKGIAARAHLYMEETYSKYKLSKSDRKLYIAWDKKFEVKKDECLRTSIIEKKQKNTNKFVKKKCISLGYL